MPEDLIADLDHAHAQRDAALQSLAATVRILVRTGGYMTPEDQRELRRAQALLAELGAAPAAPADGRRP